MKTPLDILLGRSSSLVRRLFQQTPVVFRDGEFEANNQQFSRWAEAQRNANFFVRTYVLPDGRKVRLVIQGGVERWFIEQTSDADSIVPVVVGPQLESGWFVSGTLYSSSALATYLASGELLPTEETRVLDGHIAAHANKTCTSTRAPDWPDGPPSLNTHGARIATVWPAGPLVDPTRCSGLAVLWAQCGGTKPSEWSGLSPEQLAVIRSPLDQGPVWHLLAIGATGILAVRLIVPSEWGCLTEWLLDEDLELDLRRRIEGWILRVAQPERDAQNHLVITEVADSAAMDDWYDGRTPITAVVWTDQLLGSAWQDEAKCGACLWNGGSGFGSAWRIRSHFARGTISYANGIPSWSGSTEAYADWTPGDTACRLGLPEQGNPGHWVYVAPPSLSSPAGDNGPIYFGWRYGHVEQLGYFRYTEPYTRNSGAVNWAQIDSHCGPGTTSGRQYSETVLLLGWDIDGGTPLIPQVGSDITNTYSLAGGTPYQVYKAYYNSGQIPGMAPGGFGTYWANTCPNGELLTLGPYPDTQSCLNPETRTPIGINTRMSSTERTYNSGTGGNILLLGHGASTYAVFTSRSWSDSVKRTRTWTGTADAAQSPEWSSAGVIQDSLGGVTAKYNQSVSSFLQYAPYTDAYDNGLKSSFTASIMAPNGTIYTSSDADYWTWISTERGGAPEGQLWSAKSYGGETVLAMPNSIILPDGIDPVASVGRPVGLI